MIIKELAAKGLSCIPGMTLQHERELLASAVVLDMAEQLAEDEGLCEDVSRASAELVELIQSTPKERMGLVLALTVFTSEKGDPRVELTLAGTSGSLHMAAEAILGAVVQVLAEEGCCPCEKCLAKEKLRAAKSKAGQSKEKTHG